MSDLGSETEHCLSLAMPYWWLRLMPLTLVAISGSWDILFDGLQMILPSTRLKGFEPSGTAATSLTEFMLHYCKTGLPFRFKPLVEGTSLG